MQIGGSSCCSIHLLTAHPVLICKTSGGDDGGELKYVYSNSVSVKRRFCIPDLSSWWPVSQSSLEFYYPPLLCSKAIQWDHFVSVPLLVWSFLLGFIMSLLHRQENGLGGLAKANMETWAEGFKMSSCTEFYKRGEFVQTSVRWELRRRKDFQTIATTMFLYSVQSNDYVVLCISPN